MPAVALLVTCLVLGVPSSWAQEDQSIVISTQKNTYGPGDTVALNGTISGGAPGQLVAIQVKDSKGDLILIRTVQADQNGNFVLAFKVPSYASQGSLDITASARINGFVITQAKSTTVPEFQYSGLALALGVFLPLSFYAISSKRFGMQKGGGM